MNELIRKLEKQSGIEIFGLGKHRAQWEGTLEKFAELIIAEGIKQLQQERFKLADDLDTRYDDGYVDGIGRAEYILKKSFGVNL